MKAPENETPGPSLWGPGGPSRSFAGYVYRSTRKRYVYVMESRWVKRSEPDYLASLEHAVAGRRALLDARENLTKGMRQAHPLDAVAHVLGSLDMLELAERRLVEAARLQGSTWEQIGAVFGVTRQAAFQRFGGGSEVDSERAS